MNADLEANMRATISKYFERARAAEAEARHLRAMLNAQMNDVPEYDLVAHLMGAIAFSRETFGPGARTKGVIAHIQKELKEIEANPSDLVEWIDVMILAMDGAWRCVAANHPGDASLDARRMAFIITDALAEKQARNQARTWPDWRTASPDQPIEHDRTGEAAA